MLATLTRLLRHGRAAEAAPVSVLQTGNTGPYCTMASLLALRWTARTLKLTPARRAIRQQAGHHRSRFRGRGMEFSEVRAYQPGDDVRSIDWRVTARRQKPHTKLFNEERERPVFIVCDQSMSQFFGSRVTFKSVRAAEAAALIAWTALDHGDRVGGLVFSETGHRELKPARSRKKLLQLLQTITDYNRSLHVGQTLPNEVFGLTQALTEAERLVKPGTLLVIVSDFLDHGLACEELLQRLARHNEMMLIRTTDLLESSLPGIGFYPLSNGDETLVLDTGASDRQRYQDNARNEREQLQALSQRLRAALIEVPTHEAPAQALQHALRSLGR